jgi:ferredoxin
MERVNPGFIRQVQKMGAFDATACYSCGNCTATCPLSEGRRSFPRKMVRYALLGLTDKIRRSPELWLCHYCGDCSDSCPREADPGALMMALRNYTIVRTSLGRLAGLFYNRAFFWVPWLLLTALAVGGLLLVSNPYPNLAQAVPLSFIGLRFLHDFGVAMGAFLAVVVLAQMGLLAVRLRPPGVKIGMSACIRGFFKTLIQDVVLQKKQLTCKKNDRYIAHMSIFWGFMGLLLATVLVFGVDFFGFPETFRLAAKIVGIGAGLALTYGAAVFLFKRFEAKDSYAKLSLQSDWVFLGLLFLSGVTGFALDVFMWLNMIWPTYITFAIHLIVVFELLVTLPFTKFAHALYRPFALWLVESGKRAEKAG